MRLGGGDSVVISTNVSDYTMTVFFLVKKGYGSRAEIEAWDTPEFLDAVEYESILNDIEEHEKTKAKQGGKT